METEGALPTPDQPAKATSGNRVSVACIPCRSRHVRCDAQQPVCLRCTSENRTCQYVKSKRGGLDRARLAAFRRNRNAAAAAVTAVDESPAETSPESRSPARHGKPDDVSHSVGSFDSSNLWSAESESSDDREAAYATPNSMLDIHFSSVDGDPFIRLFYKHFHRCHPCVLPQRNLQQTYERNPYQQSLILLIAVMRFVGSFYAGKDLSALLHEKVTENLATAQHLPFDPFLAQFHLLYSIASYWSGELERSRVEMDAAAKVVIDLGMHRRRFVATNANDDFVVHESYRRTWWQVYLTDAYYAAIKRSGTFPLSQVDTDVDLPCEEDEYESGCIPTPSTLEEFDLREFAPDDKTFSSFAYLIGATRSLALALSSVPAETSMWSSAKVIAEVDAITDGWFLLLPKSKREVMSEGNVVDELMFQAHLAIHANLIALHRPFSKFPFHPLEGMSTCLGAPPDRLPAKDLETVHTQRCLRSIEAQIRLLVLPAQPFRRDPFTICMTAAGTTTLLAAIKNLFTGRQLAIARHQLRLVIGILKAMAKVWPQGGRNLDEIRAIAQEVLSQKAGATTLQHLRLTHSPDKNTHTRSVAAAPSQSMPIGNNSMMEATGALMGMSGVDGAIEHWGGAALMAFENQDFVEPYWDVSHDFQPWFSSY